MIPAVAAIRTWFEALPPNARGLLWNLMSAFAFMSMIMLVRYMSKGYNTGELFFWRAAIGLVLFMPVVLRAGPTLFRTRRAGLHVFRNLMHFVGIACWFYAVAAMNLSMAMALQFTIPLFTIVLAILFLGEKVEPARWLATAIGFAGVLIILRPGMEPITLAAVMALVSAVGYAGSNVTTKALVREDAGDTVVFYMNLMHVPMALVLAEVLGGLKLPPLADLPWLIAIGACGTAAHWLMARALSVADASLVVIIDFTKLPWVTLGALVIFGEAPVVWAWVGGAVIFFATFYIARREARAKAPAAKGTK